MKNQSSLQQLFHRLKYILLYTQTENTQPDIITKTYVGTFSQEAKYAAPCVFQDIFNVRYPLSGAKRVFGFFPGADKRICGMFVGFDRVTISDFKCMLSGAKTNDV